MTQAVEVAAVKVQNITKAKETTEAQKVKLSIEVGRDKRKSEPCRQNDVTVTSPQNVLQIRNPRDVSGFHLMNQRFKKDINYRVPFKMDL